MIYETLQILKEQLDAYLIKAGLGKIVVLNNVAMLESGSDGASDLEGKVIISLIHIKEEPSLKNIPAVKIVNNQAEYSNAPVNVNLFVMVSAYCDSYENSLLSISKTVEFFQGKSVFTQANTVYERTTASMDELESFKFILELYTPDFDGWNQIWGTLGGRQLPSVIYKVQLIRIDAQRKLATNSLVTEINGTLKDINK